MLINRIMSESCYGTHITPLITAVLNTSGTVIELGMGDFSTTILHTLCKHLNRKLISAETSKEWMNKFKDLETDFHIFEYVPVYENTINEINPEKHLWNVIGTGEDLVGVVLVDNRPGDRRKDDIERFAYRSQIVVVHDTEAKSYEYEPSLKLYKYRLDYKRYNVYTTLVSNFIDVSKLL